MSKQRGFSSVVTLIIVILVAGIAGGSFYIREHQSSNPVPVNNPSPSPSIIPLATATPTSNPSPSITPTPASSSSLINLDNTNDHQTVHVKVGNTITITLTAASGMTDYTLTEPFSPVLTPIPSGTMPAQGVMIRSFKVSGKGTVQLTASSSQIEQITPGSYVQTNHSAGFIWEITLISD